MAAEKPQLCPWCGSKPVLDTTWTEGRMRICCNVYKDPNGCWAAGPLSKDRTDAIAAWNRITLKPLKPAPQKRVGYKSYAAALRATALRSGVTKPTKPAARGRKEKTP